MKVLITGATGFIGQHFLKRLQGSGVETVCLARNNSANLDRIKGLNTEIRIADLEDMETLDEDLFKDIELVFHFAGSVFGRTRSELFRTNLQITENLYRALKRSPVRRFVFLSSLAAVGPVSRDETITESTAPKPISDYGRSKLAAELRLKNLQQEVGKEICIIRSPLIYGKGLSDQSRLLLFIDKIKDRTFKFIGDGENVVGLCQVDNLIDFLLRTMEFRPIQYEIFHVADPVVLTLKRVASLVAGHLGVETPKACIPIYMAWAMGFFLESISKVTASEPYLTRERVLELSGHWKIDLTKVKTWGFRPREDWEARLLDTVSWHLKKGGMN